MQDCLATPPRHRSVSWRPERRPSMPAEHGAAGLTWRCRTVGLVAEIDPALVEVVGRHLDRDAIAGEGTDAMLAHFPGGVGEDFVVVIQPDAKVPVGQHLGDRSVEFEQLFLCQSHSFQAGGRGRRA